MIKLYLLFIYVSIHIKNQLFTNYYKIINDYNTITTNNISLNRISYFFMEINNCSIIIYCLLS